MNLAAKYAVMYIDGIKSTLSDADIINLAKHDLIIMNPAVWNIRPNIYDRIKSLHGDTKILMRISCQDILVSGLATSGYDVEWDLEKAIHGNSWTAARTNGTSIIFATGVSNPMQQDFWNYPNTELLDMTYYCPVSTGTIGNGKKLNDWLPEYLITGVSKKYQIDGFYFDDLMLNPYEYTRQNVSNNVDIDRDNVADSAATIELVWTSGIKIFVNNFFKHANNFNVDSDVWYSGNFNEKLQRFDGFMWEGFANKGAIIDPPYGDVSTSTDFYTHYDDLVDSGLKVCLHRWSNNTWASGTGVNRKTYSIPGGLEALAACYDQYACISSGHRDAGLFLEQKRNNINFSWASEFGKAVTELTWVSGVRRHGWRLFTKKLAVFNNWMNVSESPNSFNFGGVVISDPSEFDLSGLVINVEQLKDYKLDYGFEGILGTGVGKHLNHFGEIIKIDTLNKMELAINTISQDMDSTYGEFGFDSESDLICQIYWGDGEKKSFPLKKSVDRWSLYGYNALYSGGLTGHRQSDPNPHFGQLMDFDEDNGKFHSLLFSTAPATGYHFILYHEPNSKRLTSSAFLMVS